MGHLKQSSHDTSVVFGKEDLHVFMQLYIMYNYHGD